MKIIIIGSAHPLRGGGISTFNERLAEVLQEKGEQVEIYSFSLQYPSFLFPGKSQFTTEPKPAGITIRSIINSINPISWVMVGLKLKKHDPSLIIVRYWLPFMGPCFGTILRIAKKKDTRVVSIVDNVIPHEKRPGDVAFTKYFLKPVDAFVAMSREVLNDLRKFTQKPAAYSPHPVYDNYGKGVSKAAACRELGLPDGEKYILFFGFIRKYKGLDLLLKAMVDPEVKTAGVKLIVAGEYYDDKQLYLDLLKECQLEEDTVKLYTDFIPNDRIKYFFGAADLVVQPYRSATQSGITQIAYHFEKPMVVTNVGGLPEGVPDGKVGFVCEPDPTAIAEAIVRFYQPNSLPDLHNNILKEKEKYSWDTFVNVLMKTTGL